jgi:PPOX class probable F420-dependent enzyme
MALPSDRQRLDPEVRGFLEERARVATLATTRKNGHPWLQPLWFALDGDDVMIVLLDESVAAHAVRRTGRAALCVHDENLPYRLATLECSAAVVDTPGEVQRWLSSMVSRYRPLADADAVAAEDAARGIVLVRLTIERVTYMREVVGLQDAERAA